jgi:hypothetical protein
MPEDVRLYSSASDDINRALGSQAVTRSLSGAKKTSGRQQIDRASMMDDDDGTAAPLMLAGSLALLIALTAGAGYLSRRRWRGAARLRPRH